MIVVGLDVHKHSLTAVVVDELGRTLAREAARSTGRSSTGRRRWALTGCGRLRTVGTSRAHSSERWALPASESSESRRG
jgi:hypothetical protein